jgi:hypothetical protein
VRSGDLARHVLFKNQDIFYQGLVELELYHALQHHRVETRDVPRIAMAHRLEDQAIHH